jgi:hypothetical protein
MAAGASFVRCDCGIVPLRGDVAFDENSELDESLASGFLWAIQTGL